MDYSGDLPLIHPVCWVLRLLHQEISFFIHSITFFHPEEGCYPTFFKSSCVNFWQSNPKTVPNSIHAEKRDLQRMFCSLTTIPNYGESFT